MPRRGMEYIDGLTNKEIESILISYNGQKHVLGIAQDKRSVAFAVLDESENATLAQKLMVKHITDVTRELVASTEPEALQCIKL